jgi:hypothetical protein
VVGTSLDKDEDLYALAPLRPTSAPRSIAASPPPQAEQVTARLC